MERGSTAAGAGGVGAGGGLSFALGRSLVGGSLSLGARGLFRARGALWGRKVPPPPAPAAVPQKEWEEEKGLMCLVRRAAAPRVGGPNNRHFNHYFNSGDLTIRHLENKFGQY